MEPSNMRMLRIHEVCRVTGLGRSTVWSYVNKGLLPPQVKIGSKAVGWPSMEIDRVVQARIAGLPDNDIKNLVCRLIEGRKTYKWGFQ